MVCLAGSAPRYCIVKRKEKFSWLVQINNRSEMSFSNLSGHVSRVLVI